MRRSSRPLSGVLLGEVQQEGSPGTNGGFRGRLSKAKRELRMHSSIWVNRTLRRRISDGCVHFNQRRADHLT